VLIVVSVAGALWWNELQAAKKRRRPKNPN
jgi:hypothetical protein